jgi:hypothetical protein
MIIRIGIREEFSEPAGNRDGGPNIEMFKTMLQTASEGCEIILYRSFGAMFFGASVASTDADCVRF